MFGFLFGSKHKRVINRISKTVDQINSLESSFEQLNADDLLAKSNELKDQVRSGEALEKVLPQAFALVRESSKRNLGLRHYDCQLVGGVILNEGKIAEMATGEGKTLVATLPCYLNALTGKGVYVITVNEYLAERDANWMRPLFEGLGLTVSHVVPNQSFEEKKNAYQADVVYITNNEAGFDYLRDNMAMDKAHKMQKDLFFAVVDEVDSILIDEARTPLVISGVAEDNSEIYKKIGQIIPRLKQEEFDLETGDVFTEGDFQIDEKVRSAELTEKGHENVERLLVHNGLLKEDDSLYASENLKLLNMVQSSLRAFNLFEKNTDYLVQNGQVVLIDTNTGRALPGRRLSDGVHQALELKENVNIQVESQTLASTTFQNFFRLFDKLSGMTGTAETEAQEFEEIYSLETIVIPTNLPMIRDDKDDKIYLTLEEKYDALVEEIETINSTGAPILVGTISVETSELISSKLKQRKIEHNVLNAKQHEREAEIISQAGAQNAVTIATNMAGRGTDIVLGGNEKDASFREKVLSLGGLHVIGTERHESRRVDNQLRGRSGRQGDPGSSQFFLSLEDSLMKIFAPERVKNLMQSIGGMKKGESIEHRMLTGAIERAQRRVEGRNFDLRKRILEFDDVLNEQRQVIYSQREEILQEDDLTELIDSMRFNEISDLVYSFLPPSSVESQWQTDKLKNSLSSDFAFEFDPVQFLDDEKNNQDNLIDEIVSQLKNKYLEKRIEYSEVLPGLEKQIVLQVIDISWKNHINALEYLRQNIGFRSYAGKDPRLEYKREAFEMFEGLLTNINAEAIKFLSKIQINKEEQPTQESSVIKNTISHKEEIQSAFDSPQEQVNKNKSEPNEEFSGNRRMRRLQAKAKRKKRK
ncbi:MAG: preprotein translocase subunit SecA [Gammaproteobacteria bacterium]|nr:MAG: preprotein translocase subunit SecA [Gammaproteobacteria bacterium]|tara:strand:+ start:2658 stop:5273 length:2616 start_codon:yes stop_codon:yes gene_type:complete